MSEETKKSDLLIDLSEIESVALRRLLKKCEIPAQERGHCTIALIIGTTDD